MESSAQRRRRRRAWFDTGAHAIACVVSPKPPHGYVCPLCLDLLTIDDLNEGRLTDEHVPPESVGGKPLVLTCVTCNRSSSRKLDEPLANEEKLRTFGTPHTVGPLPGSVTIGGIANNGSIRFDGATFQIVCHGEQNNSQAVAAHIAALNEMPVGATFRLNLTMKRAPRRAALGWHRSAYLAAFAVYGYRYVLQPAFDVLRAAIADPDDTAIFNPGFVSLPDDGPLNPLIAEVTAPAPFAGTRAAAFGPRLIFLPPRGAPRDWFASFDEQAKQQGWLDLTLTTVIGRRFPESPMHLTDG